ncbi:MAG: hypothetical protein V3W18_03760 [candidate division Zixibacteria bacterium]
MRWITDFFGDLGGSLMGGGFYTRALSYSPGRCWRFLLMFLFLMSLVLTIHIYGIFSNQYQKIVNFAEENDYEVVFENGVISNMPASLKMMEFEGDTLAVWQWIQDWSDTDSLRQLYPNVVVYVGPNGVFRYGGAAPRSMMYPEGYTGVIDSEYLKNLRTGYSWIFFLVVFVVLYLISIPWAAIAILVFVVPVMTIKFSKIGLKFGLIWKLGMFMVSLHFLYFTITTILSIDIPYGWIFNFPLYIFVVAFLVKIDPDHMDDLRKSEST